MRHRKYLHRKCSLAQLPPDSVADLRMRPPGEESVEIPCEEERKFLDELLGILEPRDQFILRSAFGLGETERDKATIARLLGVRRQAISKRIPMLIERLRSAGKPLMISHTAVRRSN
jgi:DNA-directed RNA polymerase specialized sigma subunit